MMKNWKTTSAGLTLIIGAVVSVIFTLQSGNITQEFVMGVVASVLGGIGLLFAKDKDSDTTA